MIAKVGLDHTYVQPPNTSQRTSHNINKTARVRVWSNRYSVAAES